MSYPVRATTSGTAPALAFTQAFANEHPEFTQGRFDAYVIAPGRLLVAAPVDTPSADQDDPLLGTFLSFLEQQMREHPELIRPFTARDMEGVDQLLAGAEVDLDGSVDDDFELP